MAKRRQTTGLPKAKKAENTEESKKPGQFFKPLSEYQTKAEREAAVQRLVLLGTGAAVGLILLIVAVALLFDQVITPGRTVASVNGESISVGEFRDRVRLERVISTERINAQINDFIDFGLNFEQAGQQVISFEPYSTLWDELNFPDQMGLRVLNDLINERLIREEAENLGITVTQEDIDERIRAVFNFDTDPEDLLGDPMLDPETDVEADPEATEEPTPTPFVSPTPSPEPSPTPSPEVEPTPEDTPFPTIPPPPTLTADERRVIFDTSVEEFYERARRDAGASRDEINAYFELQALRVALSREVIEPDETEVWVNARHILVETEEEALDLIDALNSGESFAALARAVSQDTGSGSRGGELDWGPAAQYVEPFRDAVIDAPIGQIVGPVQSDFGFHIIQVRAREDRDLNEFQVELNREEAFAEWVSELRAREENEVSISNIWPDYVPSEPQFLFRER